jgi:hypothetical protein
MAWKDNKQIERIREVRKNRNERIRRMRGSLHRIRIFNFYWPTHGNGGRRPYRIDCRQNHSRRTLWLRAGPPVVPPSREAIGAELH